MKREGVLLRPIAEDPRRCLRLDAEIAGGEVSWGPSSGVKAIPVRAAQESDFRPVFAVLASRPAQQKQTSIGLLVQNADHSALILAARMTLAHFSVSSAISFAKSPGEPGNTVPPRSAR